MILYLFNQSSLPPEKKETLAEWSPKSNPNADTAPFPLTRARSARVAGAASLVDECAPMAALRGVVTRSGPPPANHGAP
jgi:hypothetical protein